MQSISQRHFSRRPSSRLFSARLTAMGVGIPWELSLVLGASCALCLALCPTRARAAAVNEDEGQSRYVEVVGARCAELQGVYPLGGVGEAWSEALLQAATQLCDAEAQCAGVMRYVGDNAEHCQDWCGRPQFCTTLSTGEGFSANTLWVSYVKAELYPATAGHEAVQQGSARPETAPLGPGEDWRQLDCNGLVSGPGEVPPVVLISAAILGQQPPVPGACHVLHWPWGEGDVGPARVEESFVDGVLTEVEQDDLPVFAAAGPPTDFGFNQTRSTLYRYFFDPVPEMPTAEGGRGRPGSKRHVLSVFFLSATSSCNGGEGQPALSVDYAKLEIGAQHVYVDDATHVTREAAVKHYHFTLMCGDFSIQPFPPPALVYSLAYVSHAMVPEFIHWKASRMFYHLPDAAQGVRSLKVANLQVYLENMLSDPKQDKLLEYKQTFTLLMQQLFWYRYIESARKRAEVYACALCDAKSRELKRQGSVSGQALADPGNSNSNNNNMGTPSAVEASSGGPTLNSAVAVVMCVMSRRSAHELRQVVRDTWGQGIAASAPTVVQRFFVGRKADTPIADYSLGDVVELPVPESYRTLNVKALSMLTWAHQTYPNLQWLVRHDDDVYLRAHALLAQLAARPPVRYFWGMFDHGSSPVRDPAHQHYNSYEQFAEQTHPAWGDIFPPYARGLLWAMSADLLGEVVADFMEDVISQPKSVLDQSTADTMPHPDDPAIGVIVTGLVKKGMSVNIDDRDFNSFSLNPSCNSTFSNMHNRTWVVHHVQPETMRCMWELDSAENAHSVMSGNSAVDASLRVFPDLCLCSAEVEEEHDGEEEPFWYDRTRFNSAR
ncbi:unnamed protein product [Polarella glacialis]|uniref:Hexosyltransferase n=1 Tax=Polarella glacialis TaxID=89957 RepID=A0A813J5T9_POLGL|nr:unnamed protein product [Polarella glacialis]